jgi:PST family polysaccharide transporter
VRSSYREIFSSTLVIGGVQVVNILFGIARTKVVAVVLGPAGMGIVGLYQAVLSLIATLTGFGIAQSAVRQIAESAASDDAARIGRTTAAVRSASIAVGLLGMLLVVALRVPLARATFRDDSYATDLAITSLAVLLGAVSAGQSALLQGLRRIKDLASSQIAGTVLGTALSVSLIYWLHEAGIVPFLVASSAASLLCSWWFAHRVRMTAGRPPLQDALAEVRGLLALGGAFLLSGLLSTGAAYISRILLMRELGMAAVGLYSAAWMLSSLYVGIVLNAMGADFYPRLTAVARDNAAANRLTNEQVEMGVLIATPGILGTIALAPWVLATFYSSEFRAAAGIIRWQILGVALRVVSWPIGYIIIAKGRPRAFALVEVFSWTSSVALLAACTKAWGLEGAGIAFAMTYAIVLTLVCSATRTISGFSFSPNALRVVAFAGLSSASALLLCRLAPSGAGTGAAVALTAVASGLCVRRLSRLLGVGVGDLLGELASRRRRNA